MISLLVHSRSNEGKKRQEQRRETWRVIRENSFYDVLEKELVSVNDFIHVLPYRVLHNSEDSFLGGKHHYEKGEILSDSFDRGTFQRIG